MSSRKTQLKAKYGDEQVFVIPHMIVSGIPNGFTREKHTQEIWTKYDNHGKYIYRYDAEDEPALQQLIPHILVQNKNTGKYFVSQRLSGSGEQRLVGNYAIGFGGHINPCDGTQEVLFKAFFRELNEELVIDPTSSAKFLGYVRDFKPVDKTKEDVPVSSVHIGCVFIIQANDAAIKETDKLAGQWMDAKELEENYFKFEDWGKYIVDYLVANKGEF